MRGSSVMTDTRASTPNSLRPYDPDKRWNVIITGSRDFPHEKTVRDFVRLLATRYRHHVDLYVGDARGVDHWAALEARNWNRRDKLIGLQVFKADWDTLGKRAGYIRNEQMVRQALHAPGRVTRLFAFWDGKSNGTRHTIDIAATEGVKTYKTITGLGACPVSGWYYKCENVLLEGHHVCARHAFDFCYVCGAKGIEKECAYAGGAFACGVPLCGDCEHHHG